jgi:hypothetical protein
MIKLSYHNNFGSLTRRQRKLTCLINLSVVFERIILKEIFSTERELPTNKIHKSNQNNREPISNQKRRNTT